MSMRDWDIYFLRIAEGASFKSKDPKSKLGAVLTQDNIIVSTGFNGFPRGVDEADARWERPTKYQFVAHAELNAICNAARIGAATKGATLYLFGFPGPCNECAKAIIQAGISRVVWIEDVLKMTDPEARAKWELDLIDALLMLDEAGVLVTAISPCVMPPAVVS